MTGYLIAFVFGILIMGALIAQREKMGSGGFNAWLKGKGAGVRPFWLVVIALIQSWSPSGRHVGVVKRLRAVRQGSSPACT
jgi:hypothetical protein